MAAPQMVFAGFFLVLSFWLIAKIAYWCFMATPAKDMIEITLRLPKEAADTLKLRAASSGHDVGTFASHLVEHFTEPPTPLEILSGPIYQRFLESGMTDDELGEELERAKHEMRAERRARHAS
jgi:hypothetical protein